MRSLFLGVESNTKIDQVVGIAMNSYFQNWNQASNHIGLISIEQWTPSSDLMSGTTWKYFILICICICICITSGILFVFAGLFGPLDKMLIKVLVGVYFGNKIFDNLIKVCWPLIVIWEILVNFEWWERSVILHKEDKTTPELFS